MFTGIVEEIGSLGHVTYGTKSAKLSIQGRKVLEGTQLGDSIAVNGVCLTVTSLTGNGFTADVMAETMRRSSLGTLKPGGQVNLERAMAANGRFGGHIVSGHIDGTGIIESIKQEENAVWLTVQAPSQILKYVVEKGSIAIDGVSLTVAGVDSRQFQVSLIPHTGKETILLSKGVGAVVNLENDVIGKYIEKLLKYGSHTQETEAKARCTDGISAEFIKKYQF